MPEIIVSNTGPLITLEKLQDGYGFIRKLYKQILIPQKVVEEISEGYSSFDAYLDRYQISDLIEIRSISTIIDVPGIEKLDDGEAEAVSLAQELRAELLIEEIKGRDIARSAGILVSGIAGKIGHACLLGIIDQSEATGTLQTLLNAGRINRDVFHAISGMIGKGLND